MSKNTNNDSTEAVADPLKLVKEQKERLINAWKPLKINIAKDWIDNETTQTGRKMVRGAVHFCNFGENIGCEQNEERPVIIISADTINSTSGNVLVVPLTKNLKPLVDRTTRQVVLKKGRPIPRFKSQYFLFKADYPFLTYDSAAKTEEITSVSKIRLGKHLGSLRPEDLRKLDVRARWSLGL